MVGACPPFTQTRVSPMAERGGILDRFSSRGEEYATHCGNDFLFAFNHQNGRRDLYGGSGIKTAVSRYEEHFELLYQLYGKN